MAQNLSNCYYTYYDQYKEKGTKQYFFSYYDYNIHKEVQFNDYIVMSANASEEEIRKFAASLVKNNIRDEKDIITISNIPIFPTTINHVKKKYYFTWYNYIAQSEQTNFILAENETEAKQIAVLTMKFFAGDKYTIDNIDTIGELNDNYFYTIKDIEEKYKICNKEFILPEIKEEDED
jgi:hypothetical protein